MIKKISAMVAAVIVVVIAIPLVSMTPSDEPADWEFDEYRPLGDVTSASGALEIVTVGGESYVHASGLGAGTITRSDGSEDSIRVGKAHLDVCLMLGQSNAAYADYNLAEAPVPEPGTAYYYGHASGKYSEITFASCTIHSMTSDDGTATTGDKAPSFAKKYYETTGHRVYFVCGAINGKSITTFDPDDGMTWRYASEVVEYAIKALDKAYYTYDSIAYMWIQGEADARMSIDEYKTRFLEMNDAIMDGGLGGVAFHHAFISKVRTINSGTAQIQLAEEHPDIITMATTISSTFTIDNGLMGSDGVHYTQTGDNLIGEALGESMGQWVLENPQDEDEGSILDTIIGIIPVIFVAGLIITIVATTITRK